METPTAGMVAAALETVCQYCVPESTVVPPEQFAEALMVLRESGLASRLLAAIDSFCEKVATCCLTSDCPRSGTATLFDPSGRCDLSGRLEAIYAEIRALRPQLADGAEPHRSNGTFRYLALDFSTDGYLPQYDPASSNEEFAEMYLVHKKIAGTNVRSNLNFLFGRLMVRSTAKSFTDGPEIAVTRDIRMHPGHALAGKSLKSVGLRHGSSRLDVFRFEFEETALDDPEVIDVYGQIKEQLLMACRKAEMSEDDAMTLAEGLVYWE